MNEFSFAKALWSMCLFLHVLKFFSLNESIDLEESLKRAEVEGKETIENQS